MGADRVQRRRRRGEGQRDGDACRKQPRVEGRLEPQRDLEARAADLCHDGQEAEGQRDGVGAAVAHELELA